MFCRIFGERWDAEKRCLSIFCGRDLLNEESGVLRWIADHQIYPDEVERFRILPYYLVSPSDVLLGKKACSGNVENMKRLTSKISPVRISQKHAFQMLGKGLRESGSLPPGCAKLPVATEREGAEFNVFEHISTTFYDRHL